MRLFWIVVAVTATLLVGRISLQPAHPGSAPAPAPAAASGDATDQTAQELSSGGLCPRSIGSPADVVLHVEEPTVRYDFTLDASQIQDIAASTNPDMGSESVVVRGLTVARYSVQIQLQSKRVPSPSGHGWCTYPDKVDLTIGYPEPLTVYVEANYPDNSCQHAAILRHENTHVAIHRQSLSDHLPLIRSAMEAAMASPDLPVWTDDPGEGSKRILAMADAAAEASDADLAADRNARHAYLDRPESIESTIAECRNW